MEETYELPNNMKIVYRQSAGPSKTAGIEVHRNGSFLFSRCYDGRNIIFKGSKEMYGDMLCGGLDNETQEMIDSFPLKVRKLFFENHSGCLEGFFDMIF